MLVGLLVIQPQPANQPRRQHQSAHSSSQLLTLNTHSLIVNTSHCCTFGPCSIWLMLLLISSHSNILPILLLLLFPPPCLALLFPLLLPLLRLVPIL